MAEPFPEIVSALEQLPDGLVLDGELVVPAADGRSDFEQVRRRNLIQRPRMIQEGAAKSRHVTPGLRVQLIEHVETHGEALFHAIASQDFEGIVAKRVDAPYRAGRQPAWVKLKNRDYSRRAAGEWQGR